ncbi:MAG: serine hydrolase [Bacteroidales bacterium]|nr:serine hydrolase [Bacteroidales bacterium]MDD3666994.1 serine hydrolase [Bacteroidales bacterium]
MGKTFKLLWIALVLISMVLGSCQKETTDDGFTTPGILTTKMREDLHAAAERVFAECNTPGLLALVAVEGEPDFIIKLGTANIVTNDPVSEHNAFRIGSVTKTFTATVVLMLADEGLVSLDSSVATYLPDKNIPSGDSITVRMLGNMTSGLFNYSDDPALWEQFIQSGYSLAFPPDSLLAIAFRHPLNFQPGTAYEYCNTNTVLLGLLIERVTGKPAGEAIHQMVLQPLNLNHSYMAGPFFRSGPYTHGYCLQDEGLTDATNWNPSWGYTAGAMISTPSDLKRWARYLIDGKLLSEKAKSERFNFATNTYGFGIEMAAYHGHTWYGHPGLLPGYNTQLWFNPEKKITLVISSNTDDNAPAERLLVEFIILFAGK